VAGNDACPGGTNRHDAARSLNHLVDANKATEPRMPFIQNFAFRDPVGVPTSDSTTRGARTPNTAGGHRIRSGPTIGQ
jgi:hypothetical protein